MVTLVKSPAKPEADVDIRIVERRLLDRHIDQSDNGPCKVDLQVEELLAVSHPGPLMGVNDLGIDVE